jgi:Fe-S cluster biosynthesis and repair protein YggX
MEWMEWTKKHRILIEEQNIIAFSDDANKVMQNPTVHHSQLEGKSSHQSAIFFMDDREGT